METLSTKPLRVLVLRLKLLLILLPLPVTLCPGNTDSINIVVNPGINMQFSTGPQNICSGQSTQVVTLSSSVTGVSFNWVSQPNGVSGVAAAGNNIIPVQTLVNSNLKIDSVNYLVTATSAVCPSLTGSYTIAVKPNPAINLPAPQAICSGSSANTIHFNSNIAGTTYTWTSTATVGTTGFISSGSSDSIPSLTLNNTTLDTGSVVYAISASNDGCNAALANYTIQVYPLPDISLPGAQGICNGSSTIPVSFSSHVAGTTYNWTASADTNISGAIASGTGTIPANAYKFFRLTRSSEIYSNTKCRKLHRHKCPLHRHRLSYAGYCSTGPSNRLFRPVFESGCLYFYDARGIHSVDRVHSYGYKRRKCIWWQHHTISKII